MAIRGKVVLECDSKGCHAEEIFSNSIEDYLEQRRTGLTLDLHAHGWTMDDEGGLHCPQCGEEDPRKKYDDDGAEYADPGDMRKEGLEES